MIYTFTKPYEFDGKKYETLDIPLEELTGKDMRKVQRSFTAAGLFASTPEMDCDYCVMVIRRAKPELPAEFFDDMPAQEFNALVRSVGRFLLNVDSLENQ